MRCVWDFLAKGKFVGWEERRGPRTELVALQHSRLRRGEKLATAPINERLVEP